MTRFIDLDSYSLADLEALEQQIAARKSLLQLRTYKVSFEVTFDIQSHSHDKLAPNGFPCTGSFFEYLRQTIKPTIVRDFGLGDPEGVSFIVVDLLPAIVEHSHGN